MACTAPEPLRPVLTRLRLHSPSGWMALLALSSSLLSLRTEPGSHLLSAPRCDPAPASATHANLILESRVTWLKHSTEIVPSPSKGGQGPCRATRKRTETSSSHTALGQLASTHINSELHTHQTTFRFHPVHWHSSNTRCVLDNYLQCGPFLLKWSFLCLANRIQDLLRLVWVPHVLGEGSARGFPWLLLRL